MRHQNAQDPRRVLCQSKFFGMRPQPLEQYLYSLNLPQGVERVFWLHWDAGNQRGDFTSEIPLHEVARRTCLHPSTVTRAYQRLRLLGLVRRQDPGRDPANPFQQATAVTEALIPRDALSKMLSAPSRARPAQLEAESKGNIPASSPTPPTPDSQAKTVETDTKTEVLERWNQYVGELESRLTIQDVNTWIRPLQAYASGRTLTLFAPNRFSVDWIQTNLKEYLAEFASRSPVPVVIDCRVGTRPKSDDPVPPNPMPVSNPRPRRELNTFSLARLRKQLTELGSGSEIDERFREIVWAVEQGALARFEIPHGINIAVKMVREGKWTRPNRMPPNWRRAVA